MSVLEEEVEQEVVKRTNIETEQTDSFPVLVVDGTRMMSTAMCKNFQWEMQGPVQWDFKNLSMEFYLHGKRLVLRGGKNDEMYFKNPRISHLPGHMTTGIPLKPGIEPTNVRPYRKIPFAWTPAATAAFLQLKAAMTTTPVLALPNYSKDFVVESDACGTRLGVVLTQHGWLGEVKQSWETDANIPQLILDLQQGQAHVGYAWAHGILTYHGRMWHILFLNEILVREPPDHTFCISKPSSIAEVGNWVRERAATIKHLKEHLSQAQHRIKHYTDEGRSERRLGVPQTTTLQAVGPEGPLQLEPMAVLERRMVKRGNKAVVQWLVQWMNSFPKDATWVDHSEIEEKYPHFQP
ncbi:hypothetical protein RHSIM_Rhsim06G0116400 [Rhododendron simsii]|uniref:Reverse transcriptase/retrotransposon-derived protein RNase H-like domain-containing protein n=1 Tax=Rhododendron simsii TaxID=118357 RepID=A0A834GWP6_RHOSS|nr:hypothetical protein RHSIM_Rhsim06G0116400 [Rhododendron simsii]